ncbi:hypothetical protein NDU88_001131 [Pleurodeles waltl]|uniref:Uncharacterized protein n=1 Tax=Pleurodeles waltl TaxID=8319 RepID=A0AAV7S779_PLEWA|nr:hypothetical protein NDU88_001131 [Pleurodeles waltl]
MDRRVKQALELLKEAGRLDLLAAPVAPRERPVRRAASGVAAAVVACSPPRERTQVSRVCRGRSGRLALSIKGRIKAAPKGRPRGRDGGAVGAGGNFPSIEESEAAGVPLGLVGDHGMVEEGLVFKVRPPMRTYGGLGRSEAGREEFSRDGEPEGRRAITGAGVRSISDMGFLQGIQAGSADGDPGELLAGSEPWEEEEVMAGPSTASWTGYRRGGKAVRAKELVQQRAAGPGFAPPSGRVSEGKRPGYASQGKGHATALRRPRVPAAQLEELLKKARYGQQSRDMVTDDEESGDRTFLVINRFIAVPLLVLIESFLNNVLPKDKRKAIVIVSNLFSVK